MVSNFFQRLNPLNRDKPKNDALAVRNGSSIQVMTPESLHAMKSSPMSRMALDFINASSNFSQGYNDRQLVSAYMSSVYMFAAIRRVAHLISRVRIVAEVKKDGKYVRVPETVLINRVFERDGGDILSRMYYNYAIYGSVVIYKTKTRRAVLEEARGTPIYKYAEGAVAGLYVMDKPLWDLFEDTTYGEIKGVYVSQGIGPLGDRSFLNRDEFVYLTDWNPEQPNRGKPIVGVAIHEAVANASIAQWMSEYFTAGAMPMVLVTLNDTDPAMLTQADLLRMKRHFEDQWQGVGAASRSVFFDRPVDINQVGIAPSEIGAPELNEAALESISAAVGIDRELIVTPAGGSQERHEVLVKRAWDDTIIPLAEKFIAAFNRDLGLPDGMRLVADLSGVHELEADRDDKSQTELNIFQGALQSYNETRTRLKMAPIEDLQDWFLVDNQLQPLKRIIAAAQVPHESLVEYAFRLWEGNLIKRSAMLKMLGQTLDENERDGFKSDLENGDEFLTGLWQDDLLTRRQVLEMMDLDFPKGVEDGYRSELERGAQFGDFISGLWRDNLITRSQALELLEMKKPSNIPDGFADEISDRQNRILELWREGLLPREQILEYLGWPATQGQYVDSKDERQEQRDFILGLWRDNLITRGDAVQLLTGRRLQPQQIDGFVDDVKLLTEQRNAAPESGGKGWRSTPVEELDEPAARGAEENLLSGEEVVTPLEGWYGDNVDVLPRESLPVDDGAKTIAPSVDRSAYVILDLAQDDGVLAIQEALRDKLVDDRATWVPADQFHITVAWMPEIETDQLVRVQNQLKWGGGRITMETDRILSWETNDDRVAVVLLIERNSALDNLNGALSMAVNAQGLALSPFSAPDRWRPHITLAYLPVGALAPSYEVRTHLQADRLLFERGDNYELVGSVSLRHADPQLALKERWFEAGMTSDQWERLSQEDLLPPNIGAKSEWKQWEKSATRRGKNKALRFITQTIPNELAETTRAALSQVDTWDKNSVRSVFVAQKEQADAALKTWQERLLNSDDAELREWAAAWTLNL